MSDYFSVFTGALFPGIAYAGGKVRGFANAQLGDDGLEYPLPEDADDLARTAEVTDFGFSLVARGHSLEESCAAVDWNDLQDRAPCVDHALRVFRAIRAQGPLPEDIEYVLESANPGTAEANWLVWEPNKQPDAFARIRKVFYYNIRKTNDANDDNSIAAWRMQVQKLLIENGNLVWKVYNLNGSDVVYEYKPKKGHWESTGWDFQSWLAHSAEGIYQATKVVMTTIGAMYGGPALAAATSKAIDTTWAISHGGSNYVGLFQDFVNFYAQVPGFVPALQDFAKKEIEPGFKKAGKSWDDALAAMSKITSEVGKTVEKFHLGDLLSYARANVGKMIPGITQDIYSNAAINTLVPVIPLVEHAALEDLRKQIPDQYQRFWDMGMLAAKQPDDAIAKIRDSIPWYALFPFDSAVTLSNVASLSSPTVRAQVQSMMYSPIGLGTSRTAEQIRASQMFLSQDIETAIFHPEQIQAAMDQSLAEYVQFLLKRYGTA